MSPSFGHPYPCPYCGALECAVDVMQTPLNQAHALIKWALEVIPTSDLESKDIVDDCLTSLEERLPG